MSELDSFMQELKNKRIERYKRKATEFNCSVELAEYIDDLEDRIESLEEIIDEIRREL